MPTPLYQRADHFNTDHEKFRNRPSIPYVYISIHHPAIRLTQSAELRHDIPEVSQRLLGLTRACVQAAGDRNGT